MEKNIFPQFESVRTRTIESGEFGFLPAMIVKNLTGEIGAFALGSRLYLGYMNRRALETTLETGKVTMYSMMRDRLYSVGDGDGNALETDDVLVDFRRSLLLMEAEPVQRTEAK